MPLRRFTTAEEFNAAVAVGDIVKVRPRRKGRWPLARVLGPAQQAKSWRYVPIEFTSGPSEGSSTFAPLSNCHIREDSNAP